MAFLRVGARDSAARVSASMVRRRVAVRPTEPLELLPRLPRRRHLERVEQQSGSSGAAGVELGGEGGPELAPEPRRVLG